MCARAKFSTKHGLRAVFLDISKIFDKVDNMVHLVIFGFLNIVIEF